MSQLSECWEIHRERKNNKKTHPHPSTHTHTHIYTHPPAYLSSPSATSSSIFCCILIANVPVELLHPDKTRRAEETSPVFRKKKGHPHIISIWRNCPSMWTAVGQGHTYTKHWPTSTVTLHHCGAVPQGLIRNIYACALIFNNLFT